LVTDLHERRSAKWDTYPPDVLPAHIAELDLPLAAPVKQALHAAIERDDLGYAGADQSALHEAFAGFVGRRLGWQPDPAQVTLVPDVMVGIAELLRVLCRPGSGVVICSPAYPPFFHTTQEVGASAIEVPLAVDGTLDFDGIEGAFSAGADVLLLCNPQNPTGHVPGFEELDALASLAHRYGVWVLSDEVWAPLTMPGIRHTPYLSVSEQAAHRGIALYSASKAFNLAGLKAALAVTSSSSTRRIVERLPFELHYRAGLLGLIAAEAAFVHGDRWLDDLLSVLGDRRRQLAALLAERLPGVSWKEPEAGYLAWLDCRATGLGNDPAEAFLRYGRLALSRGIDFGSPGAGHVRLNFGTTGAALDEAIDRMTRTLASAR
jgi:cysteine-S-conjugate beta-lyase